MQQSWIRYKDQSSRKAAPGAEAHDFVHLTRPKGRSSTSKKPTVKKAKPTH